MSGLGTWFRDGAVRKVLRLGVPVTIGKGVTSVASLITLALLARQLQPALFGVLALIRTVVMIVESYANANTWQMVVKYGTEAIAAHNKDDVRRVIKLAVAIDTASAVASVVVIAGIAFVVPAAFDWGHQESLLCILYSLTVSTRVAGASDGIFRIFDAYRTQAISAGVSAAVLVASIAIAVGLDCSLTGCLVASVIGEVIGNIIVTATSFWIAAQHGYGGWLATSLSGVRARLQGVVHFLVATNAQSIVKKTHNELDMVIVGSMLGKFSAGLFRVVKQLGTIPGRIIMPFEQVLFTELARCAAAGDYAGFARLLKRMATMVLVGSLLVWAVAAVAADPIVRLVAGDEYAPAAEAFRWYLLAMVLNIANAPQQRALIALGKPGMLFVFDLVTLFLIIGLMLAFATWWGLVGVALAVLAHKAVQMVWLTALITRVIRERQSSEPAPPREPAPP